MNISMSDRDRGGFSVVGIGASAGGLEATFQLLDAVREQTGMAFILVQHLDASHPSMLQALLGPHTKMAVIQAEDGLRIEPDHLYVIPPGAGLTVSAGRLRLSERPQGRGTWLPVDLLLESMATDLGPRAIAVVLTGTGEDGSAGIASVRAAGGTVMVQDPDEAAFDGMPASAVATGHVDLIAPVAGLARALSDLGQSVPQAQPSNNPEGLQRIVDLVRDRTQQDFSTYKPGTIQRRIARRMTLASVPKDDFDAYLALLKEADAELDHLSQDLLINVTGFFRDAKVFQYLEAEVIPELLADRRADDPIRLWVVGCSTGEEAYSMAILLDEAIVAARSKATFQVFATDADADALATARNGFFEDVTGLSEQRLERYFAHDGRGWQIVPDLRSKLIFSVHDALTDPSFSRIDMISCRNLMIYLGPEAQATLSGRFLGALKPGGLLLLGMSETVPGPDSRFTMVSGFARLYRSPARPSAADIPLSGMSEKASTPSKETGFMQRSGRRMQVSDLVRNMVLENHAPATVLVNKKHECLYFLGPTDRYFRVAPGAPVNDVLSMAREGVSLLLRDALRRAERDGKPVVESGGRLRSSRMVQGFTLTVTPVMHDGQALFLICLEAEGPPRPDTLRQDSPEESGTAALQTELAATQADLSAVQRELDLSLEAQRVFRDEALSVNEEFLAANDELLASKEELQSLNEELTALNSQLQETLVRQRTTADDLQNVLFSTDVATLFLDTELCIRFFTPATTSLFSLRPGDIGRPLGDFKPLCTDLSLLDDARNVLRTLEPMQAEIQAETNDWYNRRILPYRAQDGHVDGVVITYQDVTERRKVIEALAAAELQAKLANMAKSRFLAVASHDLRQPLQTLVILVGLLSKAVTTPRASGLVARLGETLGAMARMLDALLDINQIEAGLIRADKVVFPINDILERLNEEFAYAAAAKEIELRVVHSGLMVDSDPVLLEQILRNLLSNALKYTHRGKVLLGCRRRSGQIAVEVWDTGIGVEESEINAIFEEYHQIGNTGRERTRGLGLGLNIVQRLSALLDHKVRARSTPGRGSVFAIEMRPPQAADAGSGDAGSGSKASDVSQLSDPASGAAKILIVEDEAEVGELIELLLQDQGHHTLSAVDGPAAIAAVTDEAFRPDLILTDYNLPGGMDGVQLAQTLRERFGSATPVVILTGDISARAISEFARHDFVHLSKPVTVEGLIRAVDGQLGREHRDTSGTAAGRPMPSVSRPEVGIDPKASVIFLVDDDTAFRKTLRLLLEESGYVVEDYESCEAFLAARRPGTAGCLLVDGYLPGMKGLELLNRLKDSREKLPAIMITGRSDVGMAVAAMKAGAMDFVEKPVTGADLLARIEQALVQSKDVGVGRASREAAREILSALTGRQKEVLDRVLAGQPSKNIAADLGISQRTVESHRAAIMERTGAKSLPELVRMVLQAA